MPPFFDTLENYTQELRKRSGFRLKPWPLFVAGLALLALAFLFVPGGVSFALSLALFLAPVWLPLLIGSGAWRLWVILRRSLFIEKQKHILLEIKPPRGIEKTPLAMEAVLSGMHHSPGEATWYKRYILGSVRPWWSLEIASLEGRVHLFIWTRAGFRRQIESQIYAQYPGAQVVEAPDYSRLISAHHDEWSIWGSDYRHTKEDPLPIKTYIEYGLDRVQKEPEQVDPLANLIEFMGSMRKGEYLWLQLIVRVHKGEKYKKEGIKDWKEKAQQMVKKIRSETREPFNDPATGKELPGFPNPTKGQIETIAAIERNVSKLAFDVGARGIYLAKPEAFDPLTIAGLTGIFKQFSSEGWNGFAPTRWMTEFDDYPWEFGIEKLKNRYRRNLINAYRRRQFFHSPFDFAKDAMVMSTEELATIFHIPSGAVATPTLPRIQSATGEAPANLPI